MKKSIIAAIIGAVAAVSVVSFVLLFYQQQTSAQEQHIQDCKAKVRDFNTRQSYLIDRIGIEGASNDLRLQYSTLMNEGNLLIGDCGDVMDKVVADPAIKVQEQAISNQLARYNLTPGP